MDDKKKLLYNLALIQQKISTLYGATYRTVTEIAEVRKAIESGEEFTFSGNPNAAKKAEVLLDRLAASTNALLVNGIEASYTLGEKAVQRDISAYGESDTDKEAVKNIMELAEKDTRESGKNAHSYTTSKRGGLTLSDRVWNLNGNARKEIEIIIQNGILEGKSADEISGSVRGYLNNPDALFRRVLNPKTGNLELSKAAKAYHPGRGVYRSAYKNALRLARTEVNAAYRMAMWEAWQNEPLIESYEIKLSNNHTTTVKGKAVPLVDICDELAGIYPKSFKWVGWHPQCRCDMIPIKISANQFKDAVRAIKKGALEDWSKEQNERQQQKPLPDNFKNWYRKNKTRFKGVKLLPYFIADNTALLKHIRSARVAPAAPVKPITDFDRHIDYIKEWQRAIGVDPAAIKEIEALRLGTDEEALRNKVDALYQFVTIRMAEWIAEGRKLGVLLTNVYDYDIETKYKKILEDNKLNVNGNYTTAIANLKQAVSFVQGVQGKGSFIGSNMKKIAGAIGVKQGAPMTHDEADHERANPKYSTGQRQYQINCQSCVVAYELRRRGFDVKARGNTGKGCIPYDVSRKTESAWKDSGGNTPKKQKAGGLDYSKNPRRPITKSYVQMMLEIDTLTKAVGRYHLDFAWKGGRSGHIITAERHANGKFTMFDPQTGQEITDIKAYFRWISLKWGVNILQVDNLGVDVSIIGGIVEKR